MYRSLNKSVVRVKKGKLSKGVRITGGICLAVGLMAACQYAFAGDDPLEGTGKALFATLGASGMGRLFLYSAEGVVSIASFIRTRNPMVFSGIVILSVFLNAMFKMLAVPA